MNSSPPRRATVEENGAVARLTGGVRDRQAQAVVEETAVGQTGEVVVVGEDAELLLRLPHRSELGVILILFLDFGGGQRGGRLR